MVHSSWWPISVAKSVESTVDTVRSRFVQIHKRSCCQYSISFWFISFKVLKPIANLKFFISVFFWTDQNYFEMKQKLLISSEKFIWYQFESRDESSLMIHFGTSDISDSISFRSINRNPHHQSAPYFHIEFGFSWIYLWIALRFEINSTKVNFKNSTTLWLYLCKRLIRYG